MKPKATTTNQEAWFGKGQMDLTRPGRWAICLAAIVCLCCAAPVLGQTTDTWNGGSSNWNNPANWSAGVPNGNYNVFIDGGNPLASIVTLDINTAINNLTIDSDDTLAISDNHSLTVNGSSISNAGNISLNSGNNPTQLIIGSSSVTLNGGGTLTMGNNAANFIVGSAGTNLFTNQETIQGAGNIGDGQLTLSNSGTINANAGSGQNALVIQTSGGSTNTGTLEATNGSTLLLNGVSGGNVTNTSGTIKAVGTNSTVILENGIVITGGTLTTSTGGVIESLGGQMATLNGVTNSGTYSVNDNSTTILQGTITNNGTIQLNSGNNPTQLKLNGNVTLAGTGSVTMSNNSANFIVGTAGSNVLTNRETIQGAGNIGDGQMTLTNSGTINANTGSGQNPLVIQTSGGTTNTGTLEATNGSNLILTGISGGNITNTGGTIKAVGTGSTVILENGVSVTGGTITTGTGGVIESLGGQTATLNGVTNSGTYSVNDNSNTILKGTITNNGVMQLNSGNNTTALKISGNVTLAGSGSVNLSNNSANVILGNSTGTEVLTNQQTIQGAGNIGDGFLTLVNQGTVNANAGVGQNSLIMQPGSGGVTNTGTLEATNGTLVLNGGTITNVSGSTNGTIQAVGANDLVILQNGVTIAGGTLTDATGGLIETLGGQSATFDGSTHTLTNSGTFSVNDNATTTLLGTINNTGSLQLNSANNATLLRIGNATNNVTLTGGGTVTMSNNSANFIVGTGAGNTLTNVNNTIQGSGNIGDGQLTLINQSLIDANAGSGQNPLVIQTSGGTTNTGTIEATNGSNLVLTGVSGGNFTNTGGIIEALNSSTGNSVVNLQGGVTISGGTLTTTGNGVIETPGGQTASLANLTNSGTYSVNDNSTTILQGTITNNGVIQLNSGNNPTQLQTNGNVTLTGTGSVTMSNNTANFILGAAGSNVLTNQETIQGAGNIGDGQMTLINSGTINANAGAGQNALTIQTSGGTTNTGTLEATNGSTLVLNGISGGNFTNTGGTIQAAGTGSTVILENGASVTGGTLTTGTGGVIETPGGQTATLNGVTNSGTYSVNDNSTTILQGTITNTGSIQLNSANNLTQLKISGNVTLNGSGNITMSNNNANVILGNSTGNEILTSASTIQGAGNIGDGFMGFVNTGKVIANQSNPLLIDVDGAAFNNKGTVQANTGSTLEILGPAGSFTNFNSSTSTLTGGTYTANGTIQFATSNSTANDIVTNAANITLSGTSSQILDQFGGNALANFSTNAAGGSFTINSSRNFTTAGNFTNNGSLVVGSGSKFVVNGSLTNFSNTTLKSGTYNLTGTLQFNGANIVTNAANITLNGSSAKIINQSGGNALTNFATNASTGKFTISGTRTFTTKGNFTNNGTLTTSSSGSKFDVNGNLNNFSGTTLTGGIYNMTGTLQFNGANIVTNAANITLSGTSSQIIDQFGNNGLASFATNASGGSFTINNGRNFTTASDFTNNGTLAVASAASTFKVNGNLTNFSGTTLTGGTFNLTGTMQFNGANIVTNAANLTLTGTSSQIIDQNGANGLANFTTNASTGSFTINGNRSFTTAGTFTNAGLFTVATGSTFTVGGSGSLTQSGGTTTDDGTLSVGSLFNVQAGSLFGKGTVTGNVQSSGIVTPGDSSTSTGILKDTGTYTQTSNGTLDISIGGTTAGTKYDELNPTTASLNGTLNISLINGFVPTIGSTFDIMNFNSESGTFATVNGLAINSSEHFSIAYQGSDVLLTVVSGPMRSWIQPQSPSRDRGLGWRGLLASNQVLASHFSRLSPVGWRAERSAAFHSLLNNSSFRQASNPGYGIPRSPIPLSTLPTALGVNLRTVPPSISPAYLLGSSGTTASISGLQWLPPRRGLGLAESKFSGTRILPGLPVLAQTPIAYSASAPVTMQTAHFDHLSTQAFKVLSPSIAPASFARRPVPGFRFSVSAPSFLPANVHQALPSATLLNNIGVSGLQSSSVLVSFGGAGSSASGAAFVNIAAGPRYLAPINYKNTERPNSLSAGWNGSLNRSSQPTFYRGGGYRNPIIRRSFAVSLFNLTSKPKVGFDMH